MRNSRALSTYMFFSKHGFTKTLLLYLKILLLKTRIKNTLKIGDLRPIYLRNNTTDLAAFRQIFMDGQYEIPIRFKPQLIVDLGANIGLSTVYFSHRFPTARIIAIEPVKANFIQLCKNNEFNKRVKPIRAAIWSSLTELVIEADKGLGEWGASVINVSQHEREREMVNTITIEKILKEEKTTHIDILKIDIEGSEAEIFKNCSSWIKNVKLIIIELHDDIYPGSSNPFIKAIADLNNFSVSLIDENIVIKNLDLIIEPN